MKRQKCGARSWESQILVNDSDTGRTTPYNMPYMHTLGRLSALSLSSLFSRLYFYTNVMTQRVTLSDLAEDWRLLDFPFRIEWCYYWRVSIIVEICTVLIYCLWKFSEFQICNKYNIMWHLLVFRCLTMI